MWLKHLHMVCAGLTFLSFNLRGFLTFAGVPWRRARWARVAPHLIDSVLLLSGAALALRIHQYPLVHAWITAKLLAVLAYILLGAWALRLAPRRGLWVLGAADLAFAYVVAVAVTHAPFPWQAFLPGT